MSKLAPPRTPPPWVVFGEPTPYSAGMREQEWKQRLRQRVPANDGSSRWTGLATRFVLGGAQEGSRASDLDNVLDPVLSVVVNERGWCGGNRPGIQWIYASKRFEGSTGVEIEPGHTNPHWPPSEASEVLLDEPYEGPWPASATDEDFALWVANQKLRRLLPAERAVVRLAFESTGTNLGDIGTGAVKHFLDGLWPLLGGTAGRPEDWRIRTLLLVKGPPHRAVTVEVASAAAP